MRRTGIVTLIVLAVCLTGFVQAKSRSQRKVKPPQLSGPLDDLVADGKKFTDFANTVPFVRVTQGPVHCTDGSTVDVAVESIQSGHNLEHGQDFKTGNGYIVARIVNSNACTIENPRLDPKSLGYWVIRHDPKGAKNDPPQAVMVMVTAAGTVSFAMWSKKYVHACSPPPVNGLNEDAAQVRASTDRCKHGLDRMFVQTDTTKSHDPTLWMSCSLTCCYADDQIRQSSGS